MSAVYAVATMDTKGEEIAFVADCLRSAGIAVKTVDVGTKTEPTVVPDIDRNTVLGNVTLPQNNDRGQAVSAISDALVRFLKNEESEGRISGVIGIGGSGGTAIVTAAMRELSIGLPKLMVSTMASGNVGPYVDCSDITMVYSVVDVAGINAVSERVLGNAAHAMAGMVSYAVPRSSQNPTLGMTMFGVTTPCVTKVRELLTKKGFECLVFHATGSGGRAMEKLVESGLIQGVLDITTTEVADEVVGGVLSAGPQRFDALIESQVPLVVSLGAVDMVNFGERDSVPVEFRNRNLYEHNAQVTLMRTTVDENKTIAEWITNKLNRATSPVTVLIPERGVSMLDAPGQPFYDPAANEALFTTVEQQLHVDDHRRIVRVPHHINDDAFASALVEHFESIHS
ncbi:MAG: Tm-1-like ATP-binding domain-containing protein [Planctomycetales bacterium]|nr:Tm-1-like ATP-binding domain-containing protein [Planctomycetales bacterium]